MIEAAVSISLTPEARGGPFVFSDRLSAGCARASQLGFHGIELFPRAAEEVDSRKLKELLAKHRLKLAAIGTGAGWLLRKLSLTHPKGSVRREAQHFIGEIIDLASDFGAAVIIGSMQGRVESNTTRQQAMIWMKECLEHLGERSCAAGIPLMIEPLNRYETNVLNRISEGITVLKSLRTRNVKLLCDLYHMNIEEASIPEALIKAGKRLGHVHWADSNRHAMGFGHTTMEPVVKALRKIGYSGYISAEVLPLPSPESAARQTMKSYRHFFGRR